MFSRFYLVGGVIHILFVVFHVFFPQMFNWEENLANLDAYNYGIMLTYHVCLIFIFIAIVVISFVYRNQLATTDTGKAFSLMVAGVYVVRIIAQFLYFPQDNVISTLMIVGECAITVIVYLLPPLLASRQPGMVRA